MKIFSLFLGAMLACVAATKAAESASTTPEKDLNGEWAFAANPALPNVLIIGDSISMGYTLPARKLLADKANVFRAMKAGGRQVDNCGDTRIGLKNIDTWLGATRWDVIHFNWGLWDLCYRSPESKAQGGRDKVNGKLSVPPEEYERNLEQLVTRLKTTGARLIWASTSYVPPGESGRFEGDDVKYNAVAARVMLRHGVPTNDIHALTQGFDGRFSVAPGDVHFTPAGSLKIAEQVAARISATLVKTK